MQKIKFATMDGSKSFEIPWDWLGSAEVKFIINDLEAKAERGITTGTLFRVRQAEIPSATLKFIKALTQVEVYPMLQIIREVEFNLTYFEKYENTFKTVKVYAKKPEMPVKQYPVDNNTNKIIYEPFELTLTAYGGI